MLTGILVNLCIICPVSSLLPHARQVKFLNFEGKINHVLIWAAKEQNYFIVIKVIHYPKQLVCRKFTHVQVNQEFVSL